MKKHFKKQLSVIQRIIKISPNPVGFETILCIILSRPGEYKSESNYKIMDNPKNLMF
jgi:hypothetical protein